MGDVQFDDEGGEGDTMVVERERDLALSAQARQTIADIDAALMRLTDGTLRLLGRVRPADPAGAPRGDPVGDRARRGEGRRDRPSMTDDAEAEALDHATDSADLGRRPHDGCGPALTAVIVAGGARLDQLTKHWAVNDLVDGPPHRRHLDAAVEPHVQQRHGLLAGVRASGRSSASSRSSWWSCWLARSSRNLTSRGHAVAAGLVDRRRARQPRRPPVPRRRLAARRRWSTSSTSSGSRSSTSPTWRSTSAALLFVAVDRCSAAPAKVVRRA